jgi:uncharacterized protein
MAKSPTYPGVYIEEVPSGVRPITGVATSIAAFLGFFSRGGLNEARRIFSSADFVREYEGLRADSLASYAIEQFFLNGGSQAWVVRTAADDPVDGEPTAASIQLGDDAATPVFEVEAVSEGLWGGNLRVDVDYGTPDPTTTFNLAVSEVVDGEVVNTESFRNLTFTQGVRFAPDVVNDGSKLVRLSAIGDPAARPAQTGTVSALITDMSALALGGQISIDIGGLSGGPVSLASIPTTMGTLAAALQSALRSADSDFNRVTVTPVGSISTGAFLQVKAGTDNPADIVELSGALATALGLDGVSRENVQQYVLGGADAGKQSNGESGVDGIPPGPQELIDALAALDKVDLFNILVIADTDRLADTGAAQVAEAARAYAEARRAFYILDPPNADATRDEIPEIEAWLDANGTLRHKNVAAYFPRPLIADPLNEFRLRAVPAGGTIAGLYARIDGERGVWKAPAGIEATLRGVQKLEYVMTDAENGILNPLGMNCLRTFPIVGNVAWGARTLDGADQIASEWKYVPVRRLALFLEESLYRGTQFAVFEPNDEPLWAQIRLNIGAFMQGLFLQGAFQGQTPRQAYLVKCDSETTTQDDINRGIVNIIVGFAPLKPAEFVIIKILQLAGQTQA